MRENKHLSYFILCAFCSWGCSGPVDNKDERQIEQNSSEQLDDGKKGVNNEQNEPLEQVSKAEDKLGKTAADKECKDCKEEIVEDIQMPEQDLLEELLLEIKSKKTYALVDSSFYTDGYMENGFIIHDKDAKLLVGPSSSRLLIEDDVSFLTPKTEMQNLLDISTTPISAYPSYAAEKSYWIHDTENKVFRYGVLDSEGFEPELNEKMYQVNSVMDLIVYADQTSLIGVRSDTVFVYEKVDSDLNLLKLNFNSKDGEFLKNKRVLYDPSSKTIGVFENDTNRISLVKLNGKDSFVVEVAAINSGEKTGFNVSEHGVLLSFRLEWVENRPVPNGTWLFSEGNDIIAYVLEETIVTADQYFSDHFQPAIEASCLTCHVETPIQGGYLSADSVQENQSLLWAFQGVSNLAQKMSNVIGHGGGDQSDHLPIPRIAKWIELKNTSGSSGANP